MAVTDTLRLLSENWFLSEPAFFALYCQQQLVENPHIDCAVRCGQGRIEYNPLILAHKNYAETEQLMRIELIRLFLKHPYERRPEGCCGEAIAIGSDITIADGYCTLHKEKLPLRTPGYYHLPMGQYYEWYAKAVQQQQDSDSRQRPQADSEASSQPNRDSNPSDVPKPESQPAADQARSKLWQEDSLQRERINQLIERTSDWGTLPADLIERIKASTRRTIDRRHIWQGFRSAILSSQRQLTRMRPNRRTGFLQMGSTRQFDTHLLIAIDTSGSITTLMLEDFYGAVIRLFSYGMAQIDVCQFDAVMGPIHPMQTASRDIEVHGRGGTSFQPLFDYILQPHCSYDGLLILTDGQAPPPNLPKHKAHPPVLWVCSDRQAYEGHKVWMAETGRVTFI